MLDNKNKTLLMKVKELTSYLESWAPLGFQESYDNSGLIIGEPDKDITGVLITLDVNELVLEEAVTSGCNVIVAHHPVIFKGLKKLTGKDYVERTVIAAIKKDVAIYAIHTNLDNVHTGVNRKISEKLELEAVKVLAPKPRTMGKLTTFIPAEKTEEVVKALHEAGAGNIGDYDSCSFTVNGTGAFKPNDKATPFIGEANMLERVNEDRVEVVYPLPLQSKLVQALKTAHPYEEVAYYLHVLENDNPEVGSGMIGNLPWEMEGKAFIPYLKEKMNLEVVRSTFFIKRSIKRVAVCGGSGSFLLKRAIAAGADAFVSADFKYHEFFDADGRILIADIGHYESEVYTKDLIYETLSKKFSNIALRLSKVNTNPIHYA